MNVNKMNTRNSLKGKQLNSNFYRVEYSGGYRNGRLLGTGKYTMAPDNKSVNIQNLHTSFTLNIISLENNKLIAQSVTSISKEDTLVYEPQ
jgi:hypothetical protein